MSTARTIVSVLAAGFAGLAGLVGLVGLVGLAGCSGGGDGAAADPAAAPAPPTAQNCAGSCADTPTALSVADVQRVLAQGIAEAQARGGRATFAVVDRVGNVLAVYRMTGAAPTVTITSARATPVSGGLENVTLVPATLAAIAKAITGAYLSSEGNAFSTRTASQIIQEHFNPGEALAPGGPLFGVQFSQLPCSDLMQRYAGGGVGPGPMRSPLGLSADPGGFPLYKAGTVVGGVGVMADGRYGLDSNVADRDADLDEQLAFAAAFGFAAPDDRRADRITADGKTLRFSDVDSAELTTVPAQAPTFAALSPATGALVAVTGYAAAATLAGTAFGQQVSGLRADALDFAGLDAFVLVDASGVERFRPRAGTEPTGALSAAEARALLTSALRVAQRARAQIRRPLGTPARVSISLVDSAGTVLGLVRSRDAPVFGIDVSLQKARTAAFLSRASAAADLATLPDAVYLDGGLTALRRQSPAIHVARARSFLGRPTAFADAQLAMTARAVGNLARPFYPDGVDSAPPGPFSSTLAQWSPFATGLQLDLVYNALVRHIGFVLGGTTDTPAQCTGVSGFDSGFVATPGIPAIANGIQIFPGSVPVYRGRQLVGALGVSGDGVDQDDMVAFLGVDAAGLVGAPAGRKPA